MEVLLYYDVYIDKEESHTVHITNYENRYWIIWDSESIEQISADELLSIYEDNTLVMNYFPFDDEETDENNSIFLS